MIEIHQGRTGSGKTHNIFKKYHVIPVDVRKMSYSLSSVLLYPLITDDGRESVAWIDATNQKPTKDQWSYLLSWADKSKIKIIVEIRAYRGSTVNVNLIDVYSNEDEMRTYIRTFEVDDENGVLRKAMGNWWRLKSLLKGDGQRGIYSYRGVGSWDDPQDIFADSMLDPKLPRMVLGAVKQFPQQYPIIKAINNNIRRQGVSSEMIRGLINSLPRKRLEKQWAIPYIERDGTPYMKWLLSVGLTRENYHASLDFSLSDQYNLAHALRQSPKWRAGWKFLKKTIPRNTILSVDDIMNVVFKRPLDELEEEIDISSII